MSAPQDQLGRSMFREKHRARTLPFADRRQFMLADARLKWARQITTAERETQQQALSEQSRERREETSR